MKLDINNTRKCGNFTVMWKLNSTLSHQWIKEAITRKIRKYSEVKKNKTYHGGNGGITV